MNLRNVLLTLHILSAMLTLGWLAMQSMLLPRFVRQGPAAVEVLRFSHRSARMLAPLGAVVFLLGVWLALRDGAAIGMDEPWVGQSMLLFVVAMVNGAVFIARTERAALARLDRGEPAPKEAARMGMLGGLNTLILLVIVYLMVAKPG